MCVGGQPQQPKVAKPSLEQIVSQLNAFEQQKKLLGDFSSSLNEQQYQAAVQLQEQIDRAEDRQSALGLQIGVAQQKLDKAKSYRTGFSGSYRTTTSAKSIKPGRSLGSGPKTTTNTLAPVPSRNPYLKI